MTDREPTPSEKQETGPPERDVGTETPSASISLPLRVSAPPTSTVPRGMSEERQTSIANALQRFRDTVLQQNLVVLRALVEAMEAHTDPEECLEEFRGYYLKDLPESVESIADLLSGDVQSELVSMLSMDGVSHATVDTQRRSEWFATIRASITEENITADAFPPVDLEYLCTLVNDVYGTGLPYHREDEHFVFLSPIRGEKPEETAARVTVPIRGEKDRFNDLTFIWEDWEIAVGVVTGVGPRSWGGCYAMWCRKESHERWQWRYGVHDEDWRSDVYDRVEDFLDFYAHYGEQTTESVTEEVEFSEGTF